MNKIIALSPCLMLDNTRKINHKKMSFNRQTFPFDDYVVCAQEFLESDYDSRFTYIVNSPNKLGWVRSRNELLKYFYNSDADYAFWIDANSAVSKSSINDLLTIMDAIKNEKLNNCDAIFSTLGMWISQDRMNIKSQQNYLTTVTLIPAKNNRSYNWMHGLIIKNFKKYYDEELYIDTRCDTLKGLAEDVYFARLLRQFKACYVAPGICLTKPNSKGSTQWAQDSGKYDYPPVNFAELDRFIFENNIKYRYKKTNTVINTITLPRVEGMTEYLKMYEPKVKQVIVEKINLF